MRHPAVSLFLMMALSAGSAWGDVAPSVVGCDDEGESCDTGYGETGVCVDGECREADDPEAVRGGGGCASCSVGDHDTAAGIAALGLYALAAAAGGRRRRSPR